MQSLMKAAIADGLPFEVARSLITQSCIGAGFLAEQNSKMTFSEFVDDICVPGGSTEKAMGVLDSYQVKQAVREAVGVSLKANREMGA